MPETIRQILPQLYHSILPPFFDGAAPNEVKAPCGSCTMCPPADRPADPGVVYFRPDSKCCTYHPNLPNYLVGAILKDTSPDLAEGRRRIRDKITKRIGVTPRWVAAPKKYSLLLDASRESSFGRSAALRCPYYEEQGGLCTIWKHREADCSTFFCKHVGGADGQIFWRDLDTYLRCAERKLSGHAVLRVASGLTEPTGRANELTLEELEDRAPEALRYTSFWREWEGREEAFYEACHDCIAALSRDDFDRILAGDDHDRNVTALEKSYRRITAPELPERLVLNPTMSLQPAQDGVLATTYSRYEPVMLTTTLHEVLGEFSSRETVAEVKERVAREHDITIPDAMLLELYQLRVVVSA